MSRISSKRRGRPCRDCRGTGTWTSQKPAALERLNEFETLDGTVVGKLPWSDYPKPFTEADGKIYLSFCRCPACKGKKRVKK